MTLEDSLKSKKFTMRKWPALQQQLMQIGDHFLQVIA